MPESESGNDEVSAKELHDTLLKLAAESAAHFGDREPTEEETREFLRRRLIADGKSSEEADRLLDELPE